MNHAKKYARAILHRFGLDVRRSGHARDNRMPLPVELTRGDRELLEFVQRKQLSMASPQRLWATLLACKYVAEQGISGDFVECGVWHGGNALIAASIFKQYGVSKNVFLFDTFLGMTEPTERDLSNSSSAPARSTFEKMQRESHNEWCYASLDDVKATFSAAGLLSDNVRFVQGDVCCTLQDPANLPSEISVLRLDTDWYESTKVELEVLYPLLVRGGALMIDDYGHWAGARAATDEFFSHLSRRPMLQCIDETGRLAVKV